MLRSRRDLIEGGWTERGVRAAVAAGELRRLQPNRYVGGSAWNGLWPESRHRLEVAAAFSEMRTDHAVAAFASACAVWELPLTRFAPRAVHVLLPPGSRAPSRPGLRRHLDALDDTDVVVVGGIRCTSLERTVLDAARTLPFVSAVAVADAALRRVAMDGRSYDAAVAERWLTPIRDRAGAMRGVRGIRQARRVLDFADGRAELPGESVTRVRLSELGFTRFELQVPVPGPAGHDYEVDIGLGDAGALLEFDGQGKYTDAAMRGGRTIEQVVLAEKRREDWIRGVTQRPFVRLEDPHIATAATLGRRLAAFGIRAPRTH